MANEVATAKKINSEITWMEENFLPMLDEQLSIGDSGKIDDYGKQCARSGIEEIFRVIHESGVKATELNSSNVKPILSTLALYHINPSADITGNAECYITMRNVNVAAKGQTAKWEKKLELKLQTAGYEAMVSRSGRDVKTVHPKWVVREKDVFELPKHRGLEVTPPVWEPVPDSGNVIAVVIPITYKDGHTEYHFAERSGVKKNLLSHINNNLMNETFGIAPDRYKATPAEKEQIEAKKQEVMKQARSKATIEDILADEQLAKFISPAWTDNTESMIITKLVKNIVVKIPKETAGIYAQHDVRITEDGIEANVVADVEYKEVQDMPKQFNQAVKAVADKTQQTAQPDTAAPY